MAAFIPVHFALHSITCMSNYSSVAAWRWVAITACVRLVVLLGLWGCKYVYTFTLWGKADDSIFKVEV